MHSLATNTLQECENIKTQLDQAKRNNTNRPHIEKLEAKVIQLDARLKYIDDQIEKIVKENDEDIRTTLSIETERKNEMDETEESMYDREIISLIIQKNYCFFQNRLISVPF